MKRAHASVAVVAVIVACAVVGLGALFVGTERSPADAQRVTNTPSARSGRLPPSRPRPTGAGTVAAASVARPAEQRPAGHAEHGPAPSLGAHEEHADEHGHQEGHGGPGADPEEQERLYAANLERAKALIEKGSSAVLAALRGSDRDLARALVDALIDDPVAHCEKELLDGLLAWATDSKANGEDRAIALDLLGRSPGTGEETLAKIAEVALSDADQGAREAALTAIRQLAMEREDLNAATRSALTAAAEKATTAEQRGDALSSIHAEQASEAELERIARFLGDSESSVRLAAAIALMGTDAERRSKVVPSIEAAFQKETDADAASALASTALRVARADASAVFERLARTDIARTSVALARQIADYRALLADGETDPQRIEQAHQEREDARTAAEAR